MYVDSFCSDKDKILQSAQEMLRPAVEVGLQVSRLREFTGRQQPTVVT